MNTFTKYKLNVRRPLHLLQRLFDQLPSGCRISFEGSFKNKLLPKVDFSEIEDEPLVRSTKTPRQDFWIFTVGNGNRSYLRNELLNEIGLRNNVIHILIELKGVIVFSSYDNFDKDCVILSAGDFISEDFIKNMHEDKILYSYLKNYTDA